MTARLSRPERRALQRQDAAFLSVPLVLNGDPRPVAAHIRHIVHRLRDPQASSPCSEAVAHVAGLFDRSVPPIPAAPLACRKGCSHCCVQMVVLTAPEAFCVAAQLRKRPKTMAAIVEANSRAQGLTLQERLHSKIWCPLLADAICSVYAARPLACHGFVSINLEACLAAFERGAPPDIPTPQLNVTMLETCRILYMAALRLAGLPDASYEMNEVLTTIFATERAEARWLAGENILAGVPAKAPPPPQFDEAIAKMAAFVAPTV